MSMVAESQSMVAKIFKANVLRRMHELQVSQSDLAALTGYHQPVISRMLRSEHAPRLDTADRIATALQTNLVTLLIPPPKK